MAVLSSLLLGIFASVVLASTPHSASSLRSSGSFGELGTSLASNTSNSTSGAESFSGDAICVTSMCIGALVNGSNVQYTLQSQNSAPLGWMAMGFGTGMANSPMVIMWANPDGSITLSQRSAPREVMPTVESSPPFTASIDTSLSSVSGANPKFTYTIPLNSTGTQNIIWAYGTTNPGSSSVSASIVKHVAAGTSQLNLGNALTSTSRNPANPVSFGFSPTASGSSSNSSSNSTTTNGGSASDGTSGAPLASYEKMWIAHGILTTVGFLVFLPFGALIARYTRSFTGYWFIGHWMFQFVFALPVIVAGVALGISGVIQSGGALDNTHAKWGVAIFALYFVQLFLGAVAHWVKPKSAKPGIRRPLHNYVHAIIGLFLIAVSFYQVRTGFRVQWPQATGRGNVSNAANIIWYIWVVLMPVLYFAGLLLLGRQFKQEEEAQLKNGTSSDQNSLTTRSPSMRARE